MTDEQPEQFFLRVWLEALAVASKDAIAFKPKQDYAAALTLQRAFAEREADLVGALAEIIRKFDAAPDAVRNVPLGIMRARAALRSREAGHR